MPSQSKYVPTYGALMATWLDQKGEMANLPEKAGHLHVTRNILRDHVAAVDDMAEQQLEALDKAEDHITKLEMENNDMGTRMKQMEKNNNDMWAKMKQMEKALRNSKMKALEKTGEELRMEMAKAEQRNRWLEIDNQRVRIGAEQRIRWLQVENQRFRDKLGKIDQNPQRQQDRVEAVMENLEMEGGDLSRQLRDEGGL